MSTPHQVYSILLSLTSRTEQQSFLRDVESLLVSSDPLALVHVLDVIYFSIITKRISVQYTSSLVNSFLDLMNHESPFISGPACLVLSLILDYDNLCSIKPRLITFFQTKSTLSPPLLTLLTSLGKISDSFLASLVFSNGVDLIELLLNSNIVTTEVSTLIAYCSKFQKFQKYCFSTTEKVIKILKKSKISSGKIFANFLYIIYNCSNISSDLIPQLCTSELVSILSNFGSFTQNELHYSLNILILFYSIIDPKLLDTELSIKLLRSSFEFFDTIELSNLNADCSKDIAILLHLILDNLIYNQNFDLFNETWFTEGFGIVISKFNEFYTKFTHQQDDCTFKDVLSSWLIVVVDLTKSRRFSSIISDRFCGFLIELIDSDCIDPVVELSFSVLAKMSLFSNFYNNDEEVCKILNIWERLVDPNYVVSSKYLLIFITNCVKSVEFVLITSKFGKFENLVSVMSTFLLKCQSKYDVLPLILKFFENLSFHLSHDEIEINVDIIQIFDILFQILASSISTSCVTIICSIIAILINSINSQSITLSSLTFLDSDLFSSLLSAKNQNIQFRTLQLIFQLIKSQHNFSHLSESPVLFSRLSKIVHLHPQLSGYVILKLSQEVSISAPSVQLRQAALVAVENLLKVNDQQLRKFAMERIVDLTA
ncbi:hypothetical protein P9112_014674 [Eukaryota sp. TZLM1-RC]